MRLNTPRKSGAALYASNQRQFAAIARMGPFQAHREQQAAFPAPQWAFKQMSEAEKMAF